jgi:aspartate-semialdehyde dehydrogenase
MIDAINSLTKKYTVGILGATGVVGKELISVLSNRQFPISKLSLFASERSVGKSSDTKFGNIAVQHVDNINYSSLDFVFNAIGGDWPKDNLLKARNSNCVIIDNSSTFRYDNFVPLVIPEINANQIGNSKLIANPNCTTAIVAIPLYLIEQKYGLKKVIISTYQAASGAGNGAMEELLLGTKNYLENKEYTNKIFSHPLPFNLIPQIDTFQSNGYTREEMKVVWELQKIFSNPNISISCTCVRVPTLRVHSESVSVETINPINFEVFRQELRSVNGVRVCDDITKRLYPMPITATNSYDVEVGRIRQSLIFNNYGLDFFICGDQLLKGAALNAVQIAEYIIKNKNK